MATSKTRVLNHLVRNPNRTPKQIAEALGMSLTEVLDICAALYAQGSIQECPR